MKNKYLDIRERNGCSIDFAVMLGCAALTREEWFAEVSGFLEKLWEINQKFGETSAPKYTEAMRENYPKFRAVIEYLEQNVGECKVARMQQHGGDETVWFLC